VQSIHVFEPFAGWRHVEVTNRRTQIDYAQQMKYLVEESYPHARKIRIVQDNLNTHIGASLYKARQFKIDRPLEIAAVSCDPL
jgi:hypothetical protein